MQHSEALAFITMVGRYYPRDEIPPETCEVWAEALERWKYEDALAAIRPLAEDCKFFPSLAEMTDAIRAQRDARVAELRHRASLPAPMTGDEMTFSEWLAKNGYPPGWRPWNPSPDAQAPASPSE